MFHGIEMVEEEIVDKPIHAIPTKYLKMIAEIKPLDGEKTVGLTERNSTIYLIKNSGVLESLDETSFETSPVLQATFTFKKVEFFSNGRMAATEHNSSMLSIMDKTGKIQRQLQLSYTPKDLHVFKDKIFVLSGSNSEIYVYDSELRLERSIKFMNNQKETCNFILPLDISIFVSCQSAILEIGENGTLKKKFSTYGGSYSLAIAFVERSKLLFAVQRGQPQIHVFDYNAKLKTKLLQAHNSAALWSSLIIAQDRIYTLDYITNIIRIFDLPPINWSEIWNE